VRAVLHSVLSHPLFLSFAFFCLPKFGLSIQQKRQSLRDRGQKQQSERGKKSTTGIATTPLEEVDPKGESGTRGCHQGGKLTDNPHGIKVGIQKVATGIGLTQLFIIVMAKYAHITFGLIEIGRWQDGGILASVEKEFARQQGQDGADDASSRQAKDEESENENDASGSE
jgi:hypothetical protein